MADFLLKTEPSDYSFDDLVKDKQTVWTGVKNPTSSDYFVLVDGVAVIP